MPNWAEQIQDAIANLNRDFPAFLAKELHQRRGGGRVTLLQEGQLRGLWQSLWDVRKVPGDLVECGVMHGGASILMALANRKFLGTRSQFMFDSWEGFPPDEGLVYGRRGGTDKRHAPGRLKADLEQCRDNFRHFAAENPKQHFIKGYFSETTRDWTRPIALLRVDGDLYSSTKEVLDNMGRWVSRGGIIIVDDYLFDDCKQAVLDYRAENNISGNMYLNSGKRLDKDSTAKGMALAGVWWRA